MLFGFRNSQGALEGGVNLAQGSKGLGKQLQTASEIVEAKRFGRCSLGFGDVCSLPSFPSSFAAILLDPDCLVPFEMDFIIFNLSSSWQIRESFPPQFEFHPQPVNSLGSKTSGAADPPGAFPGAFAPSGRVGGCGLNGRSGLSPGSWAESLLGWVCGWRASGRCAAQGRAGAVLLRFPAALGGGGPPSGRCQAPPARPQRAGLHARALHRLLPLQAPKLISGGSNSRGERRGRWATSLSRRTPSG